MTLVSNKCMDECVTKEGPTTNNEGETQEDLEDQPEDTTMVLWNMSPGINLTEEGTEEVPTQNKYCLRSKGLMPSTSTSIPRATTRPLFQKNTTSTLFDPNTQKTWKTVQNQNTCTPSTSNKKSIPVEYSVVEDLKKIKENTYIMDVSKIAQ